MSSGEYEITCYKNNNGQQQQSSLLSIPDVLSALMLQTNTIEKSMSQLLKDQQNQQQMLTKISVVLGISSDTI